MSVRVMHTTTSEEQKKTSFGFSLERNSDPQRHTETRTVKSRALLKFKEIPSWYHDNYFVTDGYRPVSNSCLDCALSLFYAHNETVNIYTHGIPALTALVSIYLLDNHITAYYPLFTPTDRLIIAIQLLAAITCMGLSSLYHTFLCHSQSYSDFWVRMDYAGIIALIVGDFVSGIYVGFYCEPHLQRGYWGMIVTIGLITATIVLNPLFQSTKYRMLRLYSFIATGCSAFAPIIHALFLFPAEQLSRQSGIYYYYLEGALILLAAYVYGSRFPESWMPGKFNIVGSSHQIFHVLTVVATGVHLAGLRSAFDYNHTHRQCSAY